LAAAIAHLAVRQSKPACEKENPLQPSLDDRFPVRIWTSFNSGPDAYEERGSNRLLSVSGRALGGVARDLGLPFLDHASLWITAKHLQLLAWHPA